MLQLTSTAEVLRKVGNNPNFLGAQTGAVSVLHTWGQALTYHPHIHMLVPAGGLSADGMEWVKSGKKFFLPVKALSLVFRGVLWSMLESKIKSGDIKLPYDMTSIDMLRKSIYTKNWNVYAKKSLAGPEAVVQYLGKYTQRVAISNNRLVSALDGKVTFRWKDYRKGLTNQLLTLEASEFINRFMRHILPAGFYKIRYYGLLASVNAEKRQRCMELMHKPQLVSLLQNLRVKQVLSIMTGQIPDQCPKCKTGKLLPKTILDPV